MKRNRSGPDTASPESATGLSQVAHLAEMISAIQDAPDRKALQACVLNGIGLVGFDSFDMSIDIKNKRELLTPQLTSFSDNFFNDFDRNRFIDVCPVLSNSMSVDRIFSWSNRRIQKDGREKKLLDFLRAVPLARGMVVPLPHKSGRISTINLSSGEDLKYSENTIHFVSIIARVAMMRAEILGLCNDDTQARLADADLSLRQIEVLNWAAQGKSNWDIAMITSQSKRTVDYHMSEILRKLKVASRAQAIALTMGRRSSE
jgi:DNA-binding CsgD family transcriptional regulator